MLQSADAKPHMARAAALAQFDPTLCTVASVHTA